MAIPSIDPTYKLLTLLNIKLHHGWIITIGCLLSTTIVITIALVGLLETYQTLQSTSSNLAQSSVRSAKRKSPAVRRSPVQVTKLQRRASSPSQTSSIKSPNQPRVPRDGILATSKQAAILLKEALSFDKLHHSAKVSNIR